MPAQKIAIPKLFISSTVEDLQKYRLSIRDAALRTSFQPVMFEYFEAASDYRPYEACMQKVDETDLLVVIVAYRYGWIPEDQPGKLRKSITWLECERAREKGKSVLAFLVEDKHNWPVELKDSYEFVQKAGNVTPELAEKINEKVKQLENFKNYLKSLGICKFFTNPDNLEKQVILALQNWREKHADKVEQVAVAADERAYLKWLNQECAYIDIRGLQERSARAHKFGIEELYIPLTTQDRAREMRKEKSDRMTEPRRIELDGVLKYPRVTIIGEPGAGKTTFLRRIVFVLTQSLLQLEPDAAQQKLGLKKTPFPIFIRLSELAEHIQRHQSQNKAPYPPKAPAWLAHFLADRSKANSWELDEDFFLQKFKCGEAIFFFDGLDEAPNLQTREQLSALVAEALKAYAPAPFVVTSRPQAYTGRVVLHDFEHFAIEPLDEPDMNLFLQHWSQALFKDNADGAAKHHKELMDALECKPEIRRMAHNPVMLTALAVVHWNERRLPEQRADLYESIINWLLRSREDRKDRLPPDICGQKLQELALAMQNYKGGRKTLIDRRAAAEAIQNLFAGNTETERLNRAERFLAEEEVDSGIVVARGNQLTFWHLTFQEFLAARALGGQVEKDQQALLIHPEILHHPEWRETLLLFGGILYRQGKAKVDNFFKAVLNIVKPDKKLADEARCVGLLGAMLRDLTPFKYEITDPRYGEMLNRVMAIFNKEQARKIPLEVRLEAADALGQAGDLRLHPDNKDRWVTISAGSFLMGDQNKDHKKPNFDEEANDDESPVHEVQLSEFIISKFLVTVGEYQRFVDDGGYQNEKHWKAGGFGQFKEPDDWEKQLPYPSRPVVGVCWYEAMAYAAWAGYQLPTEAQWERTAKGESPIYKKYPWGDDQPDGKNTNSYDNQLGHASPVGMFPDDCTDEGVMDMGGNVREWCRDYFDSEFYRKSSGAKDPLNTNQTGSTVVRGGSWYYGSTRNFRCAFRYFIDPVNRIDKFGFRVVSSAQSVDLRI